MILAQHVDENLQFEGNYLVRSDHPSNTRRGGVCICVWRYLHRPLRVININCLNECIIFEINVGKKLYSFISLYRSPSQSSNELETFLNNLQLTIELVVRKIHSIWLQLVILIRNLINGVHQIKLTLKVKHHRISCLNMDCIKLSMNPNIL